MAIITVLIFLIISLITLPVLSQSSNQGQGNNQSWFFSTDNTYGKQTTDLQRVDDTRSFTSEALHAESESRLNRSLTKDELKDIIQAPTGFQTFNSLYFTPEKQWAINPFYMYRKLNQFQITNYYEPDNFNDVKINQYGLALQYQYCNLSKNCDPDEPTQEFAFNRVFIRGGYSRVNREGIIEFLPNKEENINEFGINSAILFNLNQNTLSLLPNYVYQDIDQDIKNSYTRKRQIFSLSFFYGTAPEFIPYQDPNTTLATRGSPQPTWTVESLALGRYDPRGKIVYGGAAYDKETYGNIDVINQDYYLGTSIREWFFPDQKDFEGFNMVVQPTVFIHKVEQGSSQDNAQFRTDLLLYYQIDKDLFFTKNLLITIPLRYDKAINGPDDYENWKVGAQLTSQWGSSKIFKNELFYLTFRYDYQRFLNLDKNLNLFLMNLVLKFN